MRFTEKILALISVYALIFITPVLRGPGENIWFDAVFAGVFLSIFLVVLFGGFFLYKKILSAIGINVLSPSGDIIKTDFGHRIESGFVRGVANIAGDAFFNLIFVLFLIFFAVASASLASDMVSPV